MPLNLRAGVCVGAAIFHQDELLLLRRIPDYPGLWELPGGSVEQGETLQSAVLREVREETGLTIELGPPFHASTFEADGQEGRKVTVVAVEFLCEAGSRTAVRLSPAEHDAFAWVNRSGLAGFRLVPSFIPIVPEAFRVRGLLRS